MPVVKHEQQIVPEQYELFITTKINAGLLKLWLSDIPDDAVFVAHAKPFDEDLKLIFERIVK